MEFKYYANIEHLTSVPTIIQNDVICASEELHTVLGSWDDFMSDETVRRYNYTDRTNGKKYQHRFGYELQVLIPGELTSNQLQIVATEFMGQLLHTHKKVSWICAISRQGKGTYLNFYICLAKFYKNEQTVKVHYSSDGYRCSVTGRLAKKDNPNAVLAYSKGDTKSVMQTRWSKKIRLFEMSKTEFTLSFIPLLKSYIIQALQKVKTIKLRHYLKYLKHKVLKNDKKSMYYNKNIRYYNGFITEANICIAYWNDAIYSPAGYYHDLKLISDWNAIRQRYQQITTNKKYKSKVSKSNNLQLSLNPWINTQSFQENIAYLKATFEKEIEVFLYKHIYKRGM